MDELFDEKIDIISWSDRPEELVRSALSPAKTEKVFINEEEQSATVIVPDFQLSLAIGKEGQNVRLAAKLCGWKIDIKSHSQYEEAQEEAGYTEYNSEYTDEDNDTESAQDQDIYVDEAEDPEDEGFTVYDDSDR